MSITQHSLHTKSKLISGSHQLKFAAAPTSVHEAQVPFDEQHEATARYLQILKWLKSAKQQLEEPTVFNNKDFARRREVLCKDVAEEIRRLEAMGELAWSRSKVDQLFGGPGLKPNDVPIVKASRSLHNFLGSSRVHSHSFRKQVRLQHGPSAPIISSPCYHNACFGSIFSITYAVFPCNLACHHIRRFRFQPWFYSIDTHPGASFSSHKYPTRCAHHNPEARGRT